MKAFREGTRKATIMHQIANTDEQIAALADYCAEEMNRRRRTT